MTPALSASPRAASPASSRAGAIGTTEQKVAELQAELAWNRPLSTSLAFDA